MKMFKSIDFFKGDLGVLITFFDRFRCIVYFIHQIFGPSDVSEMSIWQNYRKISAELDFIAKINQINQNKLLHNFSIFFLNSA